MERCEKEVTDIKRRGKEEKNDMVYRKDGKDK